MVTNAPREPWAPPEGENLLRTRGGGGGIPRGKTKFLKAPPKRTPEEHRQVRAARTQRNQWEQSETGQIRTEDASAHYADPFTGSTIPTGMIYHLKEWTGTGVGPSHWDRQLPGMSDPHAAPRPPRWEELPTNTRAHTERALAKHGTNLNQMSSDFGAQLDQAYIRADPHRPNVSQGEIQDAVAAKKEPPSSAAKPYAMDFYSHGEPRQVIDRSARELGIPQPVHAVINALTSPSTKFVRENAAGERSYPNNETAMHVVRHVQEGGSYHDITNRNRDRLGYSHEGYTVNIRKAAKVLEQHERGVHPSDWTGLPSASHPEGRSIWGPKTGPYANAWSDTHPQFFVSDIHSAGGGMLPHLGTAKPVRVNESGETRIDAMGNPSREKSEREKAIERIPFFHSAADYAARQAMQPRNLGSLRDAQAAQWGEEQLQRNLRGQTSGDQAHRRRQDEFSTSTQIPGQRKLFR